MKNAICLLIFLSLTILACKTEETTTTDCKSKLPNIDFNGKLYVYRTSTLNSLQAATDHCNNLVVYDCAFWSLPTKEELNAIYQAGLDSSGTYWSSTWEGQNFVWIQDFKTGEQKLSPQYLNHLKDFT